jgi:hypothetical protein
MTKDEARLAYGLVALYCTLFKETYGKLPVVNRYREKWAMQDVVDSLGYDRAKVILEYYFKITKSGHPLNWFFYNFDKLDISLSQLEEDKGRRELIRQKTKAMVEEYDEQ